MRGNVAPTQKFQSHEDLAPDSLRERTCARRAPLVLVYSHTKQVVSLPPLFTGGKSRMSGGREKKEVKN